MKRVAAIDCGTNSIRLLIADIQSEEPQKEGATATTPTLVDVTRQMRIVRLGQDVDTTGRLHPDAIKRTLEATREYKAMIDQLGANSIRFVATSASRDAENSQVFTDGIEAILGIQPEIISGEEEARLSFSGALSSLPADSRGPYLVVDIGGGSTEFVLGTHKVDAAVSMNMGSVRVTEKFLAQCDPRRGTDPQARSEAIAWIDQQLDIAGQSVDMRSIGTLVGVAGTITTVTAQALHLSTYQPEKIDGANLSSKQHQEAIDFMVNEPIAVKAALGFMPSGREDVIAAGSLIWERIIHRVEKLLANEGRNLGKIITSEHDILDGIALSLTA
ncbi:MAG: exopolyphosphatase [Actinobacteria bacterium]|nr:MAG: exopolyphosphatase [Actinomycetota bacterium]